MLHDLEPSFTGIECRWVKNPVKSAFIEDSPDWPDGKGAEGHDEWEQAHSSFYFSDRATFKAAYRLLRTLRTCPTVEIVGWDHRINLCQLAQGKQIILLPSPI